MTHSSPTRLSADRSGVRLATGGFGYFAAAWLGSRLVGAALMAKSRQCVPKLLQEILTAVFFFVALIATIMLVLGLSVSGALASSGIVIAVDRKSTRLNSSH